MFRGREITHQDMGKNIFDKILDTLKDIAEAEATSYQVGYAYSVVIVPKSPK